MKQLSKVHKFIAYYAFFQWTFCTDTDNPGVDVLIL
jgi:hypothetical protein